MVDPESASMPIPDHGGSKTRARPDLPSGDRETQRHHAAHGKSASRPTTVRLVTPSGTIDIAWPKPGTDDARELQRQAMRWTHVARNRARWAETASLAAQQNDNARAFLLKIWA